MKRMSLKKWSGAVAVAAFLGSAGASWACSIALWSHVVPVDEATGVPLNARISVLKNSSPTWTISLERLLPDGTTEAVPATVVNRPGTGTHQSVELVPDAPLAPNARYRASIGGDGLDATPMTTFTTGEATDEAAPSTPTLTVTETIPYTPNRQARGAECFTDTGFLRFTVESEGAAAFMLKKGEEVIAAGLPKEGSLAFTCPGADRTIEADLYAVDVAGNTSDPQPVTLEQRCVPETPMVGCSSVPGPSAAGLLALVSGALWWTRRRTARA